MKQSGRAFDLEDFYETERECYDAFALRRKNLQVRISFWERSVWDFIRKILGNIKGKSVLDLGCGFGFESILLAKEGAVVTGVDISEGRIREARNLSDKEGVDVTFKVANVDTLSLKQDYDVLFYKAALHHFPNPFNTMRRSYKFLKEGGVAIAQEPRFGNPIAMVGRSILRRKKLATETERPFRTGELEWIFRRVFRKVHVKYFGIVSPVCLTFNLVLKGERKIKSATCSILEMIDESLLTVPFMTKYAWLMICHGEK